MTDQGVSTHPPNRRGASAGKKKRAAAEAAPDQKCCTRNKYSLLGPQATAGFIEREVAGYPPECRAELARLLLLGLPRGRRKRVIAEAAEALP